MDAAPRAGLQPDLRLRLVQLNLPGQRMLEVTLRVKDRALGSQARKRRCPAHVPPDPQASRTPRIGASAGNPATCKANSASSLQPLTYGPAASKLPMRSGSPGRACYQRARISRRLSSDETLRSGCT